MEDKVTITQSVLLNLITAQTKVTALENYVRSTEYISDDVVMAILGVEKKKKGESR